MRTLFIINTIGLYLHCVVVLGVFVGRDPVNPVVYRLAPKPIHLKAYTDFVPFAIFALLTCVALWHGIGWSRLWVAVITVPPVVLGLWVYIGWWVRVI